MASDQFVAVVLGIVEGLTEYLPVSSTGHLVVAGNLLGFTGDKADTFEIIIQLGAILAVLLLYFRRFLALLSFGDDSGFAGVPGLVKLALACFPGCLVGLLLNKFIKAHLFAPLPVAAAFIFGGLVMLVVERRLPPSRIETVEEISYRTALFAGMFQCLSILWPGISRSGAMIVGGLILGLKRTAAAEFSFLVAVPMMVLASGYELYKSRELLSAADLPMFATGFIVSFVTAIFAVKGFIELLKRSTLIPFGVYRIVAGAVVLLYPFS